MYIEGPTDCAEFFAWKAEQKHPMAWCIILSSSAQVLCWLPFDPLDHPGRWPLAFIKREMAFIPQRQLLVVRQVIESQYFDRLDKQILYFYKSHVTKEKRQFCDYIKICRHDYLSWFNNNGCDEWSI